MLEFIAGRTQSADDLAPGGSPRWVADACRRLHGARRFLGDFDMFEIQARYRGSSGERGFRLPERYDEFAPQVAAMREALAVRDEGTVPCNNDLLAENFIDVGDRFRLIDYEYAGNNDACFELGNIWSESNLSLAQLDELVTHYYGRRLRHKIARARLLGLMSKYGWTLWASIQDGVSQIDFDFWSWGMEKYVRAVAEFDGPDFPRLLEEADADGLTKAGERHRDDAALEECHRDGMAVRPGAAATAHLGPDASTIGRPWLSSSVASTGVRASTAWSSAGGEPAQREVDHRPGEQIPRGCGDLGGQRLSRAPAVEDAPLDRIDVAE